MKDTQSDIIDPVPTHDAGDVTSDRAALGEEIRKLRKARSKTLAEMAQATGRSISFISQLERGRAEVPISDLKRIAMSLGVPLGWFFLSGEQPTPEVGRVVRSGERRRLGSLTSGLAEELLSPTVGGEFEMYLSTISPGAFHKPKVVRETEEEGYLVSGQLSLKIGDHHFTLGPGDSFRIASEPYQWENAGDVDVVIVWVIAPPTF